MKRILSAALALSLLGAGAPAFADPKHGKWEKDRREAFKEYEKDRRKAHKQALKEERRWREGQYMQARYYDRYIDDPRQYGLRQAPPGYRWVLVEDDAYMVRRDNGLIADIISSVLGR
jgi:Ni/Co efflux regulator RcnB